MKRSEMLEVIENVIDDLLLEGAFGRITDPHDPTRDNSIIADIRFGDVEGRILKAIEEAGMLPPPEYMNVLSLDAEKGFIGEVSYPYSQDKYGQFPMWEPEDEKK